MLMNPHNFMDRHLINLLQTNSHINQFKQIHTQIITNNVSIAAIFIKALLNSSHIDYARKVFDQITQPDKAVYSNVISAYSRLSLSKQAVGLFVSMHSSGTQMDLFAITPVLKSCASLMDVKLGRQVHSLVLNCGFESNAFVQTSLVDFYAKTGDLGYAKRVFDGILVKDPICYNCLISGYSKSGDVLAARKLFDEMGERTIVSWNSMISCYVHNGDCNEGLRIFQKMQAENCCPNEVTLVTVLSICAKLGNLKMGLEVKKCIEDNNLCKNMIVSTAIMEMYVKCGAVDEAREEFDRMSKKDVVTWSAMLAGYAQNGRSDEALELFEEMKNKQIKPNDVTLVSVLSACAKLGSVDTGERIGSYVENQGVVSNVYVTSALLDMYSKCGNVSKARKLFDKMQHKDIVTWNSMILGLAYNGFAEDAFSLFEKMVETGVKPNDITFVGILTACTHSGLLDTGLKLFKTMRSNHDVIPKVEHYACIVDLFCKSERLNDAYEFICKMDAEPNCVIWGTLLSASRNQLNVQLAELCVEKLMELEPENSGNYVQLSNIYNSLGRWQEALKVRSLMRDNSMQKTAAYSWIEMEDQVHKFLVGDTYHPRSQELYNIVDWLAMHSAWASYDICIESEF